VNEFLGDVRGHAPSGALYVIALGGNDVRDALQLADPNVVGAAIVRSPSTSRSSTAPAPAIPGVELTEHRGHACGSRSRRSDPRC
jgi:hypothetical protein